MPASRSSSKVPTYVSIVYQALCSLDDFVSVGVLMEQTSLSAKLVRTSLRHLAAYHAAESVESGGTLYWGATPDYDQRNRRIDQRMKEDEPRHVGSARKPRRNTKPAM